MTTTLTEEQFATLDCHQLVIVLEVYSHPSGNVALISYDDGAEEEVALSRLDFMP